ncbi:unnamed protein product, partial [Adineta ricciae]
MSYIITFQDPPKHLENLVNQTQSRLVLTDTRISNRFEVTALKMNVDTIILNNNEINMNESFDKFSKLNINRDNIAFTIFTSGSTGIPKAVQISHRNFTEFIKSFLHVDIIRKSDNIIQMARCTFDNHLLSLIGTLTIGATLIMLRPEGNMDLNYLSKILYDKQITVMHCVPS